MFPRKGNIWAAASPRGSIDLQRGPLRAGGETAPGGIEQAEIRGRQRHGQQHAGGIVYGYAGLVDGLVDRIKAEVKGNPKVVATGGLAEIVAPETRTIDVVDEMLTLEGLHIIYKLNRS